MRILITGASKSDSQGYVDSTSTPTATGLLANAFRRVGHKVALEPCRGMGPVQEFDFIVAALGNFRSIASRDTFPLLKLLADARQAGIPCVWVLSTWETDKLLGTTRAMMQQYASWFTSSGFDKFEEVAAAKDRVLFEVQQLDSGASFPILLPMFEPEYDSVISSRFRGGVVIPFDPSSAFDMSAYVPTQVEREERWVVASLDNCMYWVMKQGFAWPITTLGFPNTEKRVAELDVFKHYCAASAVAVPSHSTYTGRMWRSSYLAALRAGCPVFTTSVMMRDAFDSLLVPSDAIEQMSGRNRDELAAQQQADFTAGTWRESRLDEFLHGILIAT